MKKLLLSCGVILSMAAGALADDKPTNEAFWLYGSFNNWQPARVANQSKFPYKLTDEDGDGVYTGTFEFAAGPLEFKMLSEPLEGIGQWDEQNTWGTYTSEIAVFNNGTQLSFDYQSIADNGKNGSLKITNWQGGTLNLSVKWDKTFSDTWYPRVTFYAPSQPERPEIPEVYIFGDFNNWQTPSADSNNGAISISDYTSNISASYNTVRGQIDIEKCQEFKFGICKLDRASNSVSYFFPESNPPFTLYSYEEDSYAGIRFNGDWNDSFVEIFCAFDLNDWGGGKCDFEIEIPLTTMKPTLYIGAYAKNTITVPEILYAVINVDGQKWIKVCHPFNGGMFWASSDITGEEPGTDLSIIFTTEDSFNPAPETCYGLPDNANPQHYMSFINNSRMFPIVKGGKPFSYKFPKQGKIDVNIDIQCSVAYMDIDVIGAIKSDKLYVCGNVMTEPDGVANNFISPSPANQEIYDNYFMLENCGDYFQKTFYIPQKEGDILYYPDNLPQFRFFTELLGWSREASLGSAPDDFYCLPTGLSDGPVEFDIVPQGLGNWGVMNSDMTWIPNWVTMTVFRETAKLRLEIAEGGVENLNVDNETVGEESENWYNLQGIRVDRPERGLYIHVVNGNSRLELIK